MNTFTIPHLSVMGRPFLGQPAWLQIGIEHPPLEPMTFSPSNQHPVKATVFDQGSDGHGRAGRYMATSRIAMARGMGEGSRRQMKHRTPFCCITCLTATTIGARFCSYPKTP